MSEIPRAKFEVNEEVLVFSLVKSPGNYLKRVIVHVEFCPNGWISQQWISHPRGYKYYYCSGDTSHERQLKKIHKPSTDSFAQIMSQLTNPSHVAEDVGEK